MAFRPSLKISHPLFLIFLIFLALIAANGLCKDFDIWFYVCLYAIAMFAWADFITRRLHPVPSPKDTSAESVSVQGVAYLSGGADRVFEATAASLCHNGAIILNPSGSKLERVPQAHTEEPGDPVVAAVLAEVSNAKKLSPSERDQACVHVKTKLINQGLLWPDAKQARKAVVLALTPAFLIVSVCVFSREVQFYSACETHPWFWRTLEEQLSACGMSHPRFSGIANFLQSHFFFLFINFFCSNGARTAAGCALIRKKSDAMNFYYAIRSGDDALVASGISLGVALHGLSILKESPFDWIHQHLKFNLS